MINKDVFVGYTNNGVAFLVDKEDKNVILNRSWHLSKRGYITTKINRKNVPLHKILIKAKRGKDIDHISGDKLDNRKSNLRVCSHQENCFNQKRRITNTTGYIGVCKKKRIDKFESYITYNSKKHHLGLFDSAEEAAIVRDKAAIKYFGAFARLNILKESSLNYV